MMKLIITWKRGSVNFEENKAKIESEFKFLGLKCLKIFDNKTEVSGTGTEKDFSRIWISILHLEEHRYFYDAIERCIWCDDEPQEDIIEECNKLIEKGDLVVGD